ncbi:hypothetical protein OQA88_761 [Cercophora sp. LCS_1]
MAAPDPPGPDVSRVPTILGALIPVHALCALLVGLRIYTHSRPVVHLGWDDAAVVLAMAATTTQFAIFLSAIPYGAGRHNIYILPDDQLKASKLLFFSQFSWSWGVALGKISIAFLLLQLRTGVYWHLFLYAMIAVQVASALCANVVQLARCRPISAAWRFETDRAHCLSTQIIYISSYTNGTIAVLTDLMLSVIPLTFLRNIRRSRRERLVIALLMGLGVFAAAAEVVKLTHVRWYGQTGDMLWDCVGLVVWSVLAAQMGIIAACVPRLKSPLEAVLRRTGWLGEPSAQLQSINLYTDPPQSPDPLSSGGRTKVMINLPSSNCE